MSYKALLDAVPMLKATFHMFTFAFWELIDSKINEHEWLDLGHY